MTTGFALSDAPGEGLLTLGLTDKDLPATMVTEY